MSPDNEEPGADQRRSPSPGPTPARGPIQSLEDLRARGREAAQEAAEPVRPSERFGAMRSSVEDLVLNGKKARETPAPTTSAEPDKKEPTKQTPGLRPPGTGPRPTIQGPGGGITYVTAPVASPPVPEKKTPMPEPAPDVDREPTNADKLIAKIEQSLQTRLPTRPPLVQRERAPEKGRDFER